MVDLTTPLQGMQQAADRFQVAAERISRMPSLAASPPEDVLDLSSEMVALMESRNQFAANVKTARVADDMSRAALDLLG
jgi:flagellar hook protein FlgE